MKQALKKVKVTQSARRVVLAPKVRRWKVGEVARVRFGLDLMRALIVEDRGPLGRNGSQIVRVEVKARWPGSEPEQFEVAAEHLIAVKPRRSA